MKEMFNIINEFKKEFNLENEDLNFTELIKAYYSALSQKDLQSFLIDLQIKMQKGELGN